ncbi:hypothetical protein, partial [Sphingobacterium daejeonense]|uniref:hypothetical protein n=1 Tax=Sphingobacterium daejeonense TaxID=371142 RepID=UPI003D3137D7
DTAHTENTHIVDSSAAAEMYKRQRGAGTTCTDKVYRYGIGSIYQTAVCKMDFYIFVVHRNMSFKARLCFVNTSIGKASPCLL